MSFWESLKKMEEEECPYFDECKRENKNCTSGIVGCLNKKHLECEIYVRKQKA